MCEATIGVLIVSMIATIADERLSSISDRERYLHISSIIKQ